jgi:hypothetical protein
MKKLALATFALSAALLALPEAGPWRDKLLSQGHVIGPATEQARGDLILLRRGALPTRSRADLDTSAHDVLSATTGAHDGDFPRPAAGATGKQLRMVQFSGPIKREWIEQLLTTGSKIVGYIPNYAYVIRGNAAELARVADMDGRFSTDDAHPVTWMGRFDPAWKIDPVYDDEFLASARSTGSAGAGPGPMLSVEIELLDVPEAASAIGSIYAASSSLDLGERRFRGFVVLSVSLPADRLADVAGLEEVLSIQSRAGFSLHDERSAQIVAGNLTADGKEPIAPGYLSWLHSKGLDVAANFLIDVSDTGLDKGPVPARSLHPDFLNDSSQSRVGYYLDYANDGQIDDTRGHGTLVASVAGGYKMSGITDPLNYYLGVGVAPFTGLGVSRVFGHDGKVAPMGLSFTAAGSAAYAGGARVSNNSWGQGGNSYDSVAQEFDGMVRDAQPSVAGNQEMTFVFSAGNDGPGGHISSPGTAKNVITVAASENYRPEGFDTCNLDGQGGVGSDGADNARDILRFSSGGPTNDGRSKPDISAPGTHEYGAESQSPFYNAGGLCPGLPNYNPPGPQYYTNSSGTSLAAPHVTGAAALVRQFFTQGQLLPAGAPPSPAMIKAYLVNSTTYMDGNGAGGNLPGQQQGWGRLNLGRAFDGAPRVLVDETALFTSSGQTFQYSGSLADRTKPLRVTLAWTDAPGMPGGAPWVNDLDLELTVGGVTFYRGNNFSGEFSVQGGEPDRSNNVESIFIPASAIPDGVSGDFTVVVRAANIAGDGVPGNATLTDQDFALVIYNAAPPIIPPPPPMPTITAATYLGKLLTVTGHDFTAAAQVEINGSVITRDFDFDNSTNSLSIRLKRRKLNLMDGNNQIVVIENGTRSAPFVLIL